MGEWEETVRELRKSSYGYEPYCRCAACDPVEVPVMAEVTAEPIDLADVYGELADVYGELGADF